MSSNQPSQYDFMSHTGDLYLTLRSNGGEIRSTSTGSYYSPTLCRSDEE